MSWRAGGFDCGRLQGMAACGENLYGNRWEEDCLDGNEQARRCHTDYAGLF